MSSDEVLGPTGWDRSMAGPIPNHSVNTNTNPGASSNALSTTAAMEMSNLDGSAAHAHAHAHTRPPNPIASPYPSYPSSAHRAPDSVSVDRTIPIAQSTSTTAAAPAPAPSDAGEALARRETDRSQWSGGSQSAAAAATAAAVFGGPTAAAATTADGAAELTLAKRETSGPGSTLLITLLLTTGARHPYKIDDKYLKKRNIEVPDNDPFEISTYTLKELIWREWREEWEARPSDPSSIRLIFFGRMLDDKAVVRGLF
ncbi:MAG: hypothetical protein M1826_000391 [Phylliscum demangeonii]|nr:MAG: hypothetical protein M1826_000391 [Phylliscum demangeonii]